MYDNRGLMSTTILEKKCCIRADGTEVRMSAPPPPKFPEINTMVAIIPPKEKKNGPLPKTSSPKILPSTAPCMGGWASWLLYVYV